MGASSEGRELMGLKRADLRWGAALLVLCMCTVSAVILTRGWTNANTQTLFTDIQNRDTWGATAWKPPPVHLQDPMHTFQDSKAMPQFGAAWSSSQSKDGIMAKAAKFTDI